MLALILYYFPVLMFLHWHFICTSALISVIRQERRDCIYSFFIIAPKRHIFAFTNTVLSACLNVSSLTFYLHFGIDFGNKTRMNVLFFIIALKRHIFAFANTVLFACLNFSSLTFYLHFCIDFSNETGEIVFILFYNCTKKAHFCLR